jgi:ribosomal protein S6--L-glutamate ligase
VACVAPVLDQRIVRSSNGTGELRFVIEVEIRIGGSSWPVEMSLTNRDAMTYRVLIGRQALGRRFLVDPGRSFLAGRGKDADASLR